MAVSILWGCLPFSFISTGASAHLNIPAFANSKYRSIHQFKVSHQLPPSLFYTTESIEQTSELPTSPEEDDTASITDESTIEDNKDWISATRTLGSLFLRQEDANRDPAETANNRAEIEFTSFPFQENSMTSYLLKLKRQEEDNREKNKGKNLLEKDGMVGPTRSNVFRIDQVCDVFIFCVYCLPLLQSDDYANELKPHRKLQGSLTRAFSPYQYLVMD